MPEGHTVHRLARDLNDTLRPGPIRAWSPQGRFADGAAVLDRTAMTAAEAWGKYLFCSFDSGLVLHVHLGLIGKFRPKPAPAPEPVGLVRLRLESDVAAWDLSGPTRCELITGDEQAAIVARIGADPLRRRSDPDGARQRIQASSRPIGALLLDQTIIAGIGNVYRAELLFISGIHPARPGRSITDDDFDGLWAETVEQLRRGVRMGRIVTTDPDEIGRPRSRMTDDDRLYVYHREICRRCGGSIRTLEIGGRPIWYCPTDQPS
jgi:endonuclease-8